jgi:hypothetical protein
MANSLKNPYNQGLVYTSASGMLSNQKSSKVDTVNGFFLADFIAALCYCCAPRPVIYGNLLQRDPLIV